MSQARSNTLDILSETLLPLNTLLPGTCSSAAFIIVASAALRGFLILKNRQLRRVAIVHVSSRSQLTCGRAHCGLPAPLRERAAPHANISTAGLSALPDSTAEAFFFELQ